MGRYGGGRAWRVRYRGVEEPQLSNPPLEHAEGGGHACRPLDKGQPVLVHGPILAHAPPDASNDLGRRDHRGAAHGATARAGGGATWGAVCFRCVSHGYDYIQLEQVKLPSRCSRAARAVHGDQCRVDCTRPPKWPQNHATTSGLLFAEGAHGFLEVSLGAAVQTGPTAVRFAPSDHRGKQWCAGHSQFVALRMVTRGVWQLTDERLLDCPACDCRTWMGPARAAAPSRRRAWHSVYGAQSRAARARELVGYDCI